VFYCTEQAESSVNIPNELDIRDRKQTAEWLDLKYMFYGVEQPGTSRQLVRS